RAKHKAPGHVRGQWVEGNTHDVADHDAEAVQTCHCMTRAPRTGAGAHSAEYTGTVLDLAPIPSPSMMRAANSCCQV
ncbi:hypothetical protein PHISCL_10753, partial [Aspergillus sclerotialis]